MRDEKLMAMRQSAAADALLWLPTSIRRGEQAACLRGLRVLGAEALAAALHRVEGQPLTDILPLEALPVTGRLERCLDEEPPTPLATRLGARAAHTIGTSVVDGEQRLRGVLLLLYAGGDGPSPSLRLLQRRLRPALTELARPLCPARAGAVGVLLFDEAGQAIQGAEDPWLGIAAHREAAEACVAGVLSGEQPIVARSVTGATVWATRLAGRDGGVITLTYEAVEHLLVGRLLELSRLRRQIAVRAAVGQRIPEIAAELGRGSETIRSHLREVYRVLQISGRADLGYRLHPTPTGPSLAPSRGGSSLQDVRPHPRSGD